MAYADPDRERVRNETLKAANGAAARLIEAKLGFQTHGCDPSMTYKGCPLREQCKQVQLTDPDAAYPCELNDTEAANIAFIFGWDWTPPDPKEDTDAGLPE